MKKKIKNVENNYIPGLRSYGDIGKVMEEKQEYYKNNFNEEIKVVYLGEEFIIKTSSKGVQIFNDLFNQYCDKGVEYEKK